jgi:histidine ammonia-lyase
METITLHGENLSIEDLVCIARNCAQQVECSNNALDRVSDCRKGIEQATKRKTIYGVNTGFGVHRNIRIRSNQLRQLQENILLSHSVGVGENTNPDDLANYYSAEVIRAVLAIRINTFLKGHSGVRKELVEFLVRALNAGIVPLVPLRGSVGASGDLCPLAHLFATLLLKKGRYYQCNGSSQQIEIKEAKQLELQLPDPPLDSKEGLALTNGSTFSAAMLALAVYDAEHLADIADMAAALSLEALRGFMEAFDEQVHKARPFKGQQQSAKNIRRLTEKSQLIGTFEGGVQDAYSLRCAPQVHGATRDAIAYARKVVEIEINSATDNPLFFREENGEWKSYSGGNFHGQPLALAADFLAIALAELANISERRIQMLLDKNHNRGLESNLARDPGLESGFMIAQYTAASLVSENKVLAHPASVDSIPTSANFEDHVSMSTIAARKLRTVLANVSSVLAIELMVAAQAVEDRAMRVKKVKPEPKLPEDFLDDVLGEGTKQVYKEVRDKVNRLKGDAPLDEDILEIRKLIESRKLGGILSSSLSEG